MKIKKPARLSMQLALSLLIMAEISLMYALSWGAGVLLHYCFGISFNLSETVWVFFLSVIVGGAVAHYLGKWLFNPIVKLGEAMRQVAGGNFDVRLDERSRFREIREINKNFNIMAKELGATEILQTDFVTNVSHEFKTPITAIEGYAMLLQDRDLTEGERADCAQRILDSAGRLSALVSNILLLSKLEQQTASVEKSPFRLDEQIRQVMVELEPLWEPKELELELELPPLRYEGSESLLYHVWSNLLSNAVKFSPQGGALTVTLAEDEGTVVFSVTDRGPGMSADVQRHIFDKFYQGDPSRRQEGNGLGLPLARRITELCGGGIAVSSAPGRGSTFEVTLPKEVIT